MCHSTVMLIVGVVALITGSIFITVLCGSGGGVFIIIYMNRYCRYCYSYALLSTAVCDLLLNLEHEHEKERDGGDDFHRGPLTKK